MTWWSPSWENRVLSLLGRIATAAENIEKIVSDILAAVKQPHYTVQVKRVK